MTATLLHRSTGLGLALAASGALAACTPPVVPALPEPTRMLAELPSLGCWQPTPTTPPSAASPAPEPPPDAPLCEDLGTPQAGNGVAAGTVTLRCAPGTEPRREVSGYDERWCARSDGTRHGDHLQCLKVAGVLRVQQRGQYEDGKKTGTWVLYAGAHRQAEHPYRNGMLHGAIRSFHPGGKLAGLSEYRDGVLHGERASWARNGTKTDEGHYEGGLAQGLFRQWAPDGRLLGEYPMNAGTGTVIRWCENGAVATREEMASGKHDGLYESSSCEGRLQYAGRYVKGRNDGRWLQYDAAGRLLEENHYKSGVLDGESTKWWPDDGQSRWVRTYRSGRLDGPSTWFDAYGRKVAEGVYQASVAKGTWTSFYADGKKSEELVLDAGARTWTSFDPDGKRASFAELDDSSRILRVDGKEVGSSCVSLSFSIDAEMPPRQPINLRTMPAVPCPEKTPVAKQPLTKAGAVAPQSPRAPATPPRAPATPGAKQ